MEQETINKGAALESLKLNTGYKVLINEIIFPLYKDAVNALTEKEDTNARAMLKALNYIVEKIDDNINLGLMAQEEYKASLAKHTQSTSE